MLNGRTPRHDASPRRDDARGKLLARALTGAWRLSPPPLSLSARELAEITPLLLRSWGAGVGWWQARHTHLRTSPAAAQLRDAYRLHTLQAALHERELLQVIPALQAAGVDPLLAKGWAAARFYPAQGLRPYGDLDLYVRPEQYAVAMGALAGPAAQEAVVDLQRGFVDLDDRCPHTLYARSQLVRVGDVTIRIMGPEDHLRLLCLHLLRHGAVRPLWLCDVGAALEARPADFDWAYFLSGDRRRADWVICALGLAHQLLGARWGDAPTAVQAYTLPRWLVPAVIRQWERTMIYPSTSLAFPSRPLASYLHEPQGILGGLRERWHNPIEATMRRRGRPKNLPRLPYQLATYFERALLCGARHAGLRAE